MAAQTLVEQTAQVTMLDVGIEKDASAVAIPDKDFLALRKNDPNQHRYFIGDGASGVSWGKVGKGEQITPPRKHILDLVEKYLPVDSSSFSPLESLGYGGLGIGWGLQCWEYSKPDLTASGLDSTRMLSAYQTVSDRIGISATKDDANSYTIGSLKDYQQSPTMDRNDQHIYQRYLAKKTQLNSQGFYMGRTPLGLITEDKGARKKYAYRDMDFYSDNDQSAWRPWITVNDLKKKANFTYINGYLVLRFVEKKEYTEIYCLKTSDGKQVVFRCRKLILAAGALGSARIVLRSLGNEGDRLPLLCNPYSYMPCIQPRFVGQEAEQKKLGFTQLSLFLDADHTNSGASVASLYSYQSLMLFRLIRHVPLDFKDARILMRYLMSGLVIMGVHHPDKPTSEKYLQLTPSKKTPTGDLLRISYSLNENENTLIKSREKAFTKAMRKMGAYTLKRVDPGFGSSIHYAGTLPFSSADKPFRLHPSGRLYGTRRVYVADSSGFNYLPAPGLAFSLMANAHLVAQNVVQNDG